MMTKMTDAVLLEDPQHPGEVSISGPNPSGCCIFCSSHEVQPTCASHDGSFVRAATFSKPASNVSIVQVIGILTDTDIIKRVLGADVRPA